MGLLWSDSAIFSIYNICNVANVHFRWPVIFLCFYCNIYIYVSYWNMTSLDSQGEIVPVELSNPEETEI